ncbi:hypothetical protein NIES2119_04275 [[Phormidium ambiguum] IAM M-71]|uniref:Uncharacterized protein n=1 Tax=[Phormidium ambiguum] IAM M-71 TaxID=454136 RepID=A0A1U7IRX2_9CYAN|nr:hypothetical protein [Phormidium ambiguum]OKH40145.1 hypothetical protein NIES2119_04275 [Phormidium ambiguum IAM M-71]
MVDPRENVAKQARSGSVAAIIQLLNEKLTDTGVRTRAVREKDLLQLLCEAEKAEQLEKSTIVPQIQEILAIISPRNIRRAKINSRIIQEQQLLWLEEINRDPENNLLWAEEIKLPKRHFWDRWAENLSEQKFTIGKQPTLKASLTPVERSRQQWRRGIIVGALFSLTASLVGWGIYHSLNRSASQTAAKNTDSVATTLSSPNQKANTAKAVVQQTSVSVAMSDPFVAAVKLAEQAVAAGQVAKTPAQWLEIAAKWQKASDYMSNVPTKDDRYKLAQNRKILYRQSSEVALKEAQKKRAVEP